MAPLVISSQLYHEKQNIINCTFILLLYYYLLLYRLCICQRMLQLLEPVQIILPTTNRLLPCHGSQKRFLLTSQCTLS